MSKQDTTSRLCVAGWMLAVLSEPEKNAQFFFTPYRLWQVKNIEARHGVLTLSYSTNGEESDWLDVCCEN